jgi:hypothetical protein
MSDIASAADPGIAPQPALETITEAATNRFAALRSDPSFGAKRLAGDAEAKNTHATLLEIIHGGHDDAAKAVFGRLDWVAASPDAGCRGSSARGCGICGCGDPPERSLRGRVQVDARTAGEPGDRHRCVGQWLEPSGFDDANGVGSDQLRRPEGVADGTGGSSGMGSTSEFDARCRRRQQGKGRRLACRRRTDS